MYGESVLKHLWHHPDAILCCSLKVGDPTYHVNKTVVYVVVLTIGGICMYFSCFSLVIPSTYSQQVKANKCAIRLQLKLDVPKKEAARCTYYYS